MFNLLGSLVLMYLQSERGAQRFGVFLFFFFFCCSDYFSVLRQLALNILFKKKNTHTFFWYGLFIQPGIYLGTLQESSVFSMMLLSQCTKFSSSHTHKMSNWTAYGRFFSWIFVLFFIHAFTFRPTNTVCVCVYSVQNTEMWAHGKIRTRTMNENWKATEIDVKVWNVHYFACFKCACVYGCIET